MTDFKVGDKVRVIANVVDVPVGTEATVEALPSRGGGLLTVKGAGYPYFLASELELELELVKPEAVEHPAHYGGDTTYEVIKVAEAWGLDKDAYLFNVLKYIARAGKKGSRLEDLKKGGFYLNRRIKQEEAK